MTQCSPSYVNRNIQCNCSSFWTSSLLALRKHSISHHVFTFQTSCPLANPPSTTRQAGTLRTLGAAKVFISFSVINVTSLIKPTPKFFFFFVSSSSSSSSFYNPFQTAEQLRGNCPRSLRNARGPVSQGAPNVRNTEFMWVLSKWITFLWQRAVFWETWK